MPELQSHRPLVVRLIVGLSVLLFPLIVTACSGRTDAAVRWDGTMRDSAGIQVVQNHGTPMWREGDAWTFTQRLRIGVVEGDSNYMFGALTGLVVLSDGRVVAGDARYHNVRFFSPEGVHLSTLGREGSGPGEFSGFINLMLGPGDTILAIDGRNAQASRISPDGEWLGSFSTVPANGYWIVSWDDDETTREIVSLLRPVLDQVGPADAGFDLIVKRDLHGAFLDTLARVPTQRFFTGEGDNRLMHFYRGGPDHDLCDGRIVIGHSDEYRLVWQSLDGTVERVVTLDRERLEFTGEDEAALLRGFDAFAQQNQMPLERAAEIKSRMRFEKMYPAYSRFVCGPAGTLLVRRIRPVRELDEAQLLANLGTDPPGADEWDVFDREGRYLGVAPLPGPPHRHAFTQEASGAWLMSTLERDELDVPYAAVFRIEGIRQ
jgi:hypothetical protein